MSLNLPASLRFMTSKLAGFARNRVKVPVLTPASATNGDLVLMELSAGQKIDLSTLSMHFLATTTVVGGTTPTIAPPMYTSSLIQQLSIDVNGVNIASIDNYNHLWGSLANYTAGDHCQLYGSTTGEWTRNLSTGTTGVTLTALPMVVKSFLGPFASNKIIDTSLTGPIRISIRVAPTAAMIVTGSPTSWTFSMTQISFQYDVVMLDSSYDAMIQARLSDGGTVPWSFTSYTSYQGSSASLEGLSLRVPCNVQSLDYLLLTYSPSDYITAGNTLEAAAGGKENWSGTLGTGTSRFFTKGEVNKALTSYSFQIGATSVPSYRMNNACECLSMTSDALGKYSDLQGSVNTFFNAGVASGAMTNTTSAYTYGFTLCAAKLCAGNDYEYGQKLLSGLDTRGSNILISANLNGAGGASVFPLLFLQYTSTLNIGQNRQLMLVL